MTPRRLDVATHLAIHRDNFPGPHLEMVVDSILAGNTAGELWSTGQTEEAPLLVLWDQGNNVFYLAVTDQVDSAPEALAELVMEELLPHAFAGGVRRFKVRALSPSLEEDLPKLFAGIDLGPATTHFLVYDATRQVLAPPAGLSDITFLPITAALLNRDDLAGVDWVHEEIRGMWPSEDRFHERGFGIAAVLRNEIVCWCTAEYVGSTRCGIGIATAPRYERRGIATAAAAHFVQEARARGLTPCWECDRTNIASIRVAEKAGFVRQAEEAYWIGFLTKAAC